IDEPELNLVGIAENVAGVEADDVLEVIHAGNAVVSDVRLDDMLDLASEHFLVEDAHQRGRTEIKRDFEVAPVQSSVDGISDRAGRRGLQLLCVVSVAKRNLGP